MPKVLHVIDTTGPGGAETVFVELADRLRARGYESVAVIKGPGWVQDTLRERGIPTELVPIAGGYDLGYLRRLRELVLRHRIDLIQSHLLGSNLYCSLLSATTRRPLVCAFHGAVDVALEERFVGIKFGLINRFADALAMVSRQLQDDFVRRLGLARGKCHIVYNGVDTARYAGVHSDRLRREFGLANDELLIGSLGNVRPAKDYERVLEAAAELARRGRRCRFVVAGHQKRDLMAQLQSRAAELGVIDKVHFIGFIDDSAEYLANLDVFLLTSSSEGFSIATVEAMAAGLPVVSTRCGGPEEILTDGETGLFAPVGDAAAIADRLDTLIADAALRERLGEQAREQARERFDIEAMVGGYEALYRRFIG